MNLDALINKWNGKQITAFGGECVALAATYCQDNNMPIAYANAKDWWNHPALTGAFEFITNNPADLTQVPTRGNILIWAGSLPGSGGYGHIAIYDARTAPGVFRSFDQNWGGRQAHFVTHTYDHLIGWMRPKGGMGAGTPTNTQGAIIVNEGQVRRAYQLILHRDGDAGGVKNYTGKSLDFMLDDMGKSQEFLNQNHNLLITLPQIQAQLNNMQNQINEQNNTLTQLNQQLNDSKTSAADKQGQLNLALENLAKTNSELTTAHDKIKDLESRPNTTPTETDDVGRFTKFLAALLSKLKK